MIEIKIIMFDEPPSSRYATCAIRPMTAWITTNATLPMNSRTRQGEEQRIVLRRLCRPTDRRM
jgi:hypothetical protein